MRQRLLTRLLLLTGLVALLAAAAPASADAAKRRVPFGFFGTVLNPQFQPADRLTDAELDAQMATMARNGVESVRVWFDWRGIEPQQGQFNFTLTDRLVRTAARHRLSVLPVLINTPRWASSQPTANNFFLQVPRDVGLYANFARTLVQRYGSRGSFWATSGTPRNPVVHWQVWNEPAADFFWATQPWPRTYVTLLRAAYRAIHQADPKGKVVLASLAGVTSSTPWGQLRSLYRAGAKGAFDIVSVHFFSSAPTVRISANETALLARLLRREMNPRGDRRKPIWYTELTWTAAKGKIARQNELGFETTPKGQRDRLAAAYNRLARERKRLGIGRVFWFTWASEYVSDYIPGGPGAVTFQFSGLTKVAGRATFSPLPLLRTYANVARKWTGCRKSATATRCR